MKNQQVEKCQICGSPIDEEMKGSGCKTLYFDCALTMSADGAAHNMAEQLRKDKATKESE